MTTKTLSTLFGIGVVSIANEPGTGLGLMIINVLMKANQGQILIVSE